MMRLDKMKKITKGIVTISAVAGATAFVVDKIQDKNEKEEGRPSALRKKGFYEANVKRPLDCALATGGLIVLSPVLVVTSLLVRTKLGSPVIFKQERPGRDGKVFTLKKFRSMSDEKDENGELLSDEKRLTPFGELLRRLSIDELPELFNILKGDMSIIGPRPLTVRYLDYYNEEEKHRHDIRPGLTGLAQVNGRNDLPWDERFKLDVWYVNHCTFLMDLKIVFQTVYKLIKPSEIEVNGIDLEDFHVYRMKQLEKENANHE